MRRFRELPLSRVRGWGKQPQAGPSAPSRFAGSLGVSIQKQGLDCHFTQRTATWLLALVRRAVEYGVGAKAVTFALLQQVRGGLIEDGSSLSLPAERQKGRRGRGGPAAPARKDTQTPRGLTV